MLPRANAPCVPPSLNCDDGFCPRFAVDALDTIGAGDAFTAAFTAGLVRGDAPQDLLERACRLGAYVASCDGAIPDYEPAELLAGFHQ